MERVNEIQVLENYHLWLKFDDGVEKTINIKPFIGKGFTAELLDYRNFREVSIDSGGGIVWKNGYDFCPNFLKELKNEIQLA
jgi:hypothetical protein